MENGQYVYSKICSMIKKRLVEDGIPDNCIEVLLDGYNLVYHVKIKNMMGEAEYQQTREMIFLHGVASFTDWIKRDFIVPKEVEE